MRVCAVADLHGHLPDTPPCDLLLLPGDLTWHVSVAGEIEWLRGPFTEWVAERDARLVVAIAGNHDFSAAKTDVWRELPLTYLQDETIRWEGEVIHGCPWSNRFGNWAFMDDEHGLADRMRQVPNDTTILMTHGPPHKLGDLVARGEHVGSKAFARRAASLKHLKLHVFGHIHEDRGEWDNGHITANVTYVDLLYRPHPVLAFITDLKNA